MMSSGKENIFQYRLKTIITVMTAVIIAGLVMGFVWKNIDIGRMKNLDYRIHSQYILHRTESDPAALLTAVTEQLKKNKIFVIDRYQTSPTQWEILGHPGRIWLTSEFISKITVVDTVAIVEGGEQGPQRILVAYLGSIETGSKEYVFLFFLAVAATLAVLVRKEAFPHIYDGNPKHEDHRR